jgi:hypothetical protein
MGPKAACEAISKGKSKKGTVAAALGHQYVTTNLTVAHSSRMTLLIGCYAALGSASSQTHASFANHS